MQTTSRIRQHAKRPTIVWVGIAITAILAPQVLSNSSEDCKGAWGYSNASNTCSDERLSWFHNRQVCWVRTNCLTFSNENNESERNYNSIEVSFDDVYKLKNCSGTLQVEDC